MAGRSPVDRRKHSLLTDMDGLETFGALPTALPVHLDRGSLGAPVQAVLADVGCTGVLPPTGPPQPGHVGARRVVERTHSWLKDCGKLRRCTERCAAAVDLDLFLAATSRLR